MPRHYAWWFPGSPVRIHVDLRVIAGLQERLRDAGLTPTQHGLLFGRVFEGATEILEFQPAFNRSPAEMIVEASAEPGKRLLVGYYRTGEALRLNADDLLLFKNFFGKPHQVFLLIQPTGFAAPNATFFFSEGNQRISEFPFLEFPLDASLLATEERDRISRCRQAAELPAAVPESLPLEPVKPRKRSIFLRTAVVVFTTAGVLLSALWFTDPPFRNWSSKVWSGGWSALRKPRPSLAPSSLPHPRIGLQARRQDRDLELTWDRESPSVAAATSGLISIEDGSVKREIALNAQQLHGESILYSPTSDQVLIQLAITTPAGVVTESVRVIQTEQIPNYSVTAAKPPEERVQIARASKPFTAPPLSKNTPSPALLTEAPPLNSTLEHPSYPASPLAAPHTVEPPRLVSIPPPSPVPPKASPATYYPPVPIRETAPTFPAELKTLYLKATVVAIRVVIDKNGKVLKAEPLPQENAHKLFILEAVHAAQLWKFQPARRGDEPVASESILRFSFKQ